MALLTAQSLLERGDATRAAAALKPFLSEPTRPVMLLASQVALAGAASGAASPGVLKQSADQLQTWLALHPNDAIAWAQLGQAWAGLDQPLRAMRAEAEVRLALGDLNGAVDRLRAGQRSARNGRNVDFVEASVIDARLRTIEAQRRRNTIDEHTGPQQP